MGGVFICPHVSFFFSHFPALRMDYLAYTYTHTHTSQHPPQYTVCVFVYSSSVKKRKHFTKKEMEGKEERKRAEKNTQVLFQIVLILLLFK